MLIFRNHKSEVSSCRGGKCQDKDVTLCDLVYGLHIAKGTWLLHFQGRAHM